MKIIEVVGMAGVGKSTLVKPLIADYPGSYGCYRLRKSSNLLTIVKSALVALPVIAKNYTSERARNSIQAILQFEASIDDLRHLKSQTDNEILIIDQGPIYGFVSLGIYELKHDKSGILTRRFTDKYMELGSFIDGIIYLEAPIDELINRIHNRIYKHQIREFDENEQLEFLRNYDARYLEAINMFEDKFNTSVCKINTSDCSIEETYSKATDFFRSL